MIMQKMMNMLTKNEGNYRLQRLIEKAKRNEEAQSKVFASRSTYINPCKLRLGCIVTPAKIFLIPQKNDYCPV